ncbi:DMT family transporter [bacterium]|nr:DMT family transporter [bacterium]
MLVYAKLLLTAFFWGGTFIAGRVVSRSMDPYAAAFLRFAIASVFLLGLILIKEGKLVSISLKQLFFVILLGMTGVFAYNIFFFSGLHTVVAGRASIIIALNPIAISILSSIIFKEKLTVLKLFGILISVTGALVVITFGDLSSIFSDPIGKGELFIFGCVVSWVSYSLIGKMVMSNLSPLVSVAYSALAGAIALSVPAFTRGMADVIIGYSAEEWISLFYLGFFGTVLGFYWYYQALNTVGPMKSSVFINFVPVSAIILAMVLLNEPVTVSLLVGAALVLSGVLLTNFSGLLVTWLKKRL